MSEHPRNRAEPTPALVWFRNDLRIADQPALSAAAAGGRPIVACHILDSRTGSACRWWLHGSLASLQQSLAQHGGRLILRRGPPATELSAIAASIGAAEVHATKTFDPYGRADESAVAAALAARGAKLVTHAGDSLFDPEQVQTQSGEPFRVFTPFWQCCLRGEPPAPRAAPRTIRFAAAHVASDGIDDWHLTPTNPDWADGLRAAWRPGETAARARLAAFADLDLGAYSVERDRLDLAASSRLSPHLRFGEVSVRSAWFAANDSAGAGAFRRELGWREFARHSLWHWPDFDREPFRREFRRFPWRNDAAGLVAWQRGRTGYPIVDAGMRELWQTGWMHNRARMVAASFLVKHLLIAWQKGAAWFWDTLVDADVANNSVGWQWVAGSGADAAPYFRVFNPTLQGQKFDPHGDYVRRWVPELRGLPAPYIHEPWTAPTDVLRAAGVNLGATYPQPIVEHRRARAAALEAYATLRRPTRAS